MRIIEQMSVDEDFYIDEWLEELGYELEVSLFFIGEIEWHNMFNEVWQLQNEANENYLFINHGVIIIIVQTSSANIDIGQLIDYLNTLKI